MHKKSKSEKKKKLTKKDVIMEMQQEGDDFAGFLWDWNFRMEGNKALFTSPEELGTGFYSGYYRQRVYKKKNGKWELIGERNV